jgi:hypothetical protein
MTDLFSLGKLYVSDFLGPDELPRAKPHELRLVMDDETRVVHLAEQPSTDLMWGERYWYRSGTNTSMRDELFGIVREIEHTVELKPGHVWVDIASNDGTLLSFVRQDLVRIGVDPVEGDIHDEATQFGEIYQRLFTLDTAQAIRGHRIVDGLGRPTIDIDQPAKVITCIAMFYDLTDPADFLAGVHHLLDRNGVFVLQMSYTPLMLEQLAFDNICHEHARYYTMMTLHETLVRAGFQVVDATLNDTNGGSFRVFAMRDDADVTKFATQPYRDVAAYRMRALAAEEQRHGANDPDIWRWFHQRIRELRDQVQVFVGNAVADGKKVWGYGASTKGNTLLQYFGLDNTLISGIAERQEAKWGLRTIGTDIPIYSEDDVRAAKPDYMLMLPWHFVSEFTKREAKYLADGGHFIVPCPRFKIIGA